MNEALAEVLGTDPTPWILGSEEPYARRAARVEFLGADPVSPECVADHTATLADPAVRALIEQLPPWGADDFPGHHSPEFLPNRLNLLADLGIGTGDDPQVDAVIDELLDHQDRGGRFMSFGKAPGRPRPEWGSLLCDSNAIVDVALRFGRAEDPRVQAAVARMGEDSSATSQGTGWRCIPEKRSLFRGPGRANDACPQVTLEGLRVYSQLAEDTRPDWLLDAARTPLEIWRRRTEERPYMFGHGYQFKSVKWPNFWYDVLWVLETVSRYPALWDGPEARDEDRESIEEMAACLVAYNFDDDGRVTPRRTYRGFERFSFGSKRGPSPFATVRALAPLERLASLAPGIARVDVESLPGSKGGTGVPVPPRRSAPVCPTPTASHSFAAQRAIPRVLARHHIGTPHEPASIESVTADLVGFQATYPLAPYLALDARLPGFDPARLDAAIYERRSLSRVRCMRGSLFLVRHDLLEAALATTRRPVIRYAREFAALRGVTPDRYAHLAPRALNLLAQRPLTTQALRERLDDPEGVDIAALVNLMAAESLVVRDRPTGGWRDRHWTYTPFDRALPDIRPDSLDEPRGDVIMLRAYLRAFGPATHRDAAWWTGMGPKRVELALERLGDEIVTVLLEPAEEPHLMHAADVDELASAALLEQPLVAFVPWLDPLLMGYARKDRFVPDAVRPYVFDRAGNAGPCVLVNGRVVGVWDAKPEPGPEVRVYLHDQLPAEELELVRERAVRAGELAIGTRCPVRMVERATPLAERPAGAFVHPLR